MEYADLTSLAQEGSPVVIYYNIFNQGSPLSNKLISRGALEYMIKNKYKNSENTYANTHDY